MRKFALLLAVLFLAAGAAHAQFNGTEAPYNMNAGPFTGTTVPGAQAPLFESSQVNSHTLQWVSSGTVSSCTVQLEGASTAGGSYSTIGVAQTCTASGSYTVEASPQVNFLRINITAFSATGTVTFSYYGHYVVQGAGLTDGVWNVPLGACGLNATTGAFAAAGTVAGTNPGLFFTASGNNVLQGVTSAAANVIKLDCDVTPPTRSTAGQGVTVTGLQIYYGVQTTALTSITAPTVNTVTYPATGGAAAGTVAAAGGSLTVLPASLQLTTTTSGQCFSENITFGTPVSLATANRRLTLEQIFNQTAAAATTLQICGVQVFYNNNPI